MPMSDKLPLWQTAYFSAGIVVAIIMQFIPKKFYDGNEPKGWFLTFLSQVLAWPVLVWFACYLLYRKYKK